MIVLKIGKPIVVITNSLVHSLSLLDLIGLRQSEQRLRLIEDVQDVVKSCNRSQTDTITRHILVDEAGQKMQIRRAAGTEASGELGGDLR